MSNETKVLKSIKKILIVISFKQCNYLLTYLSSLGPRGLLRPENTGGIFTVGDFENGVLILLEDTLKILWQEFLEQNRRKERTKVSEQIWKAGTSLLSLKKTRPVVPIFRRLKCHNVKEHILGVSELVVIGGFQLETLYYRKLVLFAEVNLRIGHSDWSRSSAYDVIFTA